jgi:DNA-binding LytR/AlgR family response regulator
MYDFGSLDRLFYEFRKDLMTYAAVAAVFMVTGRLGRSAEPAIARRPPAADEPLFDIRDGARILRTPVDEILSVRSAGNYVEFQLADGRQPLMRMTLAAAETALSPHGFLRVHRSWLVNPRRVRALEPEGSGDWRVELDGGGFAPVSRRFPEALEALRRPA